jgi:serine/threonine protein kinase
MEAVPNKAKEKEKRELDILKCLSSVFFGHGILADKNYDTIKILIDSLKKDPIPVVGFEGVPDPINPDVSTAPGIVLSSMLRPRKKGKVTNTPVTIIPTFTKFFKLNLLRADISADSRFTFNPTNIHTGFNEPAQVIGKGTYGKIYKVEYGGKAYVVKEDLYTYSNPDDDEKHYRDLFREALNNVVLQHDPVYGGHVGRLIKVFRKGDHILFMMEHIENTLQQFVLKNNTDLEAKIAGNLLDPNLRGPVKDEYLLAMLENMIINKLGREAFFNYTIVHDTSEDTSELNYPYTFKVFRPVDGGNYKIMRLQLLEDGVALRREKVNVGNTRKFVNHTQIEWNPNSIQELQQFIFAIRLYLEKKKIIRIPEIKLRQSQEFLNPIFHTLACVLERFRNEYGFYHRDLHGGNVMVSGDGKVKIIDFGMSYLRFRKDDSNVNIVSRDSDLLLFVFSILQFTKGLDTQMRDKLNRLLTHGSDNLYEKLETRFTAKVTKKPLFHLMYYNKVAKPPDWNPADFPLYRIIYRQFAPEQFKLQWGAGDAPKFIYDNPCDMSILLHTEGMEEGGGGGGGGGAAAAVASLPSLSFLTASQVTGAAEGITAGPISPINAMGSLQVSSSQSGSQATGAENTMNTGGKPPNNIAPANPSRKRARYENINGNPKVKLSGGRRTRRKRTTRKLKHRPL